MATKTEQLTIPEDDNGVFCKRHVNYFKNHLYKLPKYFTSQDSNRMTIAYFAISGLDILSRTDIVEKEEAIDWVYSHQVLPNSNLKGDEATRACGFRGSAFYGCKYNPSGANQEPTSKSTQHDYAHVAMTYTALCVLATLGDDFSRVSKAGITGGLKAIQRKDGSFCPTIGGGETDMRFVYCACASSFMIDDWSGIDIDLTVNYILKSITYEGGVGQGPGQEAHGGSTFCAISSLWLMNKLDALSPEVKESLIRWCVMRQQTGFNGRPNKAVDTCYSWWIGSTLKILGAYHLVFPRTTRSYSLSCQKMSGGFSKHTDALPDILHSYFGLVGLSFLGTTKSLQTIFPPLGISITAVKASPIPNARLDAFSNVA